MAAYVTGNANIILGIACGPLMARAITEATAAGKSRGVNADSALVTTQPLLAHAARPAGAIEGASIAASIHAATVLARAPRSIAGVVGVARTAKGALVTRHGHTLIGAAD